MLTWIELGGTEAILTGATGEGEMVDRGIGGTDPGFGPTDRVVAVLIVKLGMLEEEQASPGTCCLPDQTELSEGAGGFPVIVFVRDGTAGGGGIEDDEVGVPGLGVGAHQGPVGGGGAEGKALEIDMGVQDGRVRAPKGTPGPAEVFMAVGFAVLFVEVEDLGFGAGAAEEGAGIGQGHAKGNGEATFPDTRLAGQDGNGAPMEEIRDEPVGGGGRGSDDGGE